MSKFSVIFSELLERKCITVYSLAQITDIDRSYLQKMKKGERIPKDASKIKELATAMRLNQTEASELLEAYHLSTLGEETYLSHKKILSIINSIYDINKNSIFIKSNMPETKSTIPIPFIVKGKNNIQNLLKMFLENTVNRGNCTIKILSQPDFSFLYDYISTLDLDGNNVIVENIISLSTSSLYNISVLEKIFPIFFNSKNFKPFYVQDNNSSIITETRFMPHKLIFPGVSIQISADYSKALVTRDKEFVNLLEDYYEHIKKSASPIITSVLTEANNYLENVISFMDFDSTNNYNLMYQPCVLPFIPEEIFLDVLNIEQLSPELFATVHAYMKRFSTYNGVMYMTTTYEGMEAFLRDNYVMEIPEFLMKHPATLEQRLVVFKNMLDAAKQGLFRINVLNDNTLKISSALLLCAYSERNIVIHHYGHNKGTLFIRLEEMGISKSFFEFLSTLHTSGLVKSQEETVALMEELYRKYAK